MKTKITLDVICPIVSGVTSALKAYRHVRKTKPEERKSSGYSKIMLALNTASFLLSLSDLVDDIALEKYNRKKKSSDKKKSLKDSEAKVVEAAKNLEDSINQLDALKEKSDAMKKDLTDKSVDDKKDENKK